MQSKIKVALAIVATLLFSTCSDDEFKPDLSGEISFHWSWSSTINKYYVLISDPEGRSLGWKELPKGQTVNMGYPPNGQTAYVTIIKSTEEDVGNTFALVQTFVDVPAGNYSFVEHTPEVITPIGQHDVLIEKVFSGWSIVPSSALNIAYTQDENFAKSTVGLKSADNNLFVSIRKDEEWKYYVKEGLEDGETTTIDEASYPSLPSMNMQDIDFPPHDQFGYAEGILTGIVKGTNSYFILAAGTWTSDKTPSLPFANVPEVFSGYRLAIYADSAKEHHFANIPFDNSTTKVETLNTTLSITENNTKRVAAEISGDGDIVTATGVYSFLDGSVNRGMFMFVYAPKTSSFAVRVPQFPKDLLTRLPALSASIDKKFSSIEVSDFNMSYQDFSAFRMQSDINEKINYVVAIEFRQ